MRFLIGIVLGAVIGFGIALWYQGEPPFAGSSSGSGEMTLILSDRYLTSLAGPAVASKSNGLVSHIRITTAPGDIAYVEGKGTVQGVTVPVGASVSPHVVNGAIVLTVRGVHLGPLPVPNVVVDPVVSIINSRVAALTSGGSLEATGAGTTSNGVEIFLSKR